MLPKLLLALVAAAWFHISATASTNRVILQLTDFHFDADYSRDGNPTKMCHRSNGALYERKCTRPQISKRYANAQLGKFGDYCCDSSWALVENAVAAAAAQLPSPSVILWTGDNVPHILGYDSEYVIRTLNATTNLIRSTWSDDIRVLPTYGNHDTSPPDQWGEADPLYAKTYELWKNWIGDEARTTFLRGGYYAFTHDNAKFLILNTNLYYRFNNATYIDNNDPAGQFEFMRNELAAAERNGRIVHIVAHISPGMYERSANFSWFRDEYNKQFLEIVIQYASTIGLMIYGHHHTDTFHIVRDKHKRAVQVCFLAPAVTPWYSDLGKGSNNPSWRTYEVDEKWQLNDIKTYFVDLDALNDNSAERFSLEYSFLEAYNVQNFSAHAMDKLVNRLYTDSKLFKRYYDHNTVMHDLVENVEAQARNAQLCSLQHADYDDYRLCLSASGSLATDSTHSVVLIVINLLFTFLLVH